MGSQDIPIQQHGDWAVLAVDKPMLTSLEADRMLGTLRDYREQTGCVRFAIDMAGVDFIDSACIGSLVTFLMELDTAGGRLVLTGCQGNVQGLLKITGLTTHITLIPSVLDLDELDDPDGRAD